MWEKLKAWFKHSLTIAWARFLVFAGVAIETLNWIAEFLQSVNALQYAPPKYVGVLTFAIGIITELARRRSLQKSA